MEATSDREMPEFRRIFKSVIDPYLEKKLLTEFVPFLREIALIYLFIIHTYLE